MCGFSKGVSGEETHNKYTPVCNCGRSLDLKSPLISILKRQQVIPDTAFYSELDLPCSLTLLATSNK
jgi:hypothetical protein